MGCGIEVVSFRVPQNASRKEPQTVQLKIMTGEVITSGEKTDMMVISAPGSVCVGVRVARGAWGCTM